MYLLEYHTPMRKKNKKITPKSTKYGVLTSEFTKYSYNHIPSAHHFGLLDYMFQATFPHHKQVAIWLFYPLILYDLKLHFWLWIFVLQCLIAAPMDPPNLQKNQAPKFNFNKKKGWSQE